MTHDPMCPHDRGAYHELGENSCLCDLIAKVREDTLDKARSLISALACPITVAEGHCEECEQYREALSCIDSLRGES